MDGPTGCGEMAMGGCVYCLKLQYDKGQLYLRRRTAVRNQTWRCCCKSDSLLAYSLKIPLAKNRPLH